MGATANVADFLALAGSVPAPPEKRGMPWDEVSADEGRPDREGCADSRRLTPEVASHSQSRTR